MRSDAMLTDAVVTLDQQGIQPGVDVSGALSQIRSQQIGDRLGVLDVAGERVVAAVGSGPARNRHQAT